MISILAVALSLFPLFNAAFFRPSYARGLEILVVDATLGDCPC